MSYVNPLTGQKAEDLAETYNRCLTSKILFKGILKSLLWCDIAKYKVIEVIKIIDSMDVNGV